MQYGMNVNLVDKLQGVYQPGMRENISNLENSGNFGSFGVINIFYVIQIKSILFTYFLSVYEFFWS